jgi:DNA-binding beta-propeller fold protein YncE
MLRLPLKRVAAAAVLILTSVVLAGAEGTVGAVGADAAPHGALIAGGASPALLVSEAQPPRVPSPDGRNIYVAAGYDGRSRVAVVRRDPVSGRLVTLKEGCSFHCSHADGLNNPVGLAVTPDGLDVIVGSRNGRLSVYRRGSDGSLRMVSCFGWGLMGCPASDPISAYPAIAVSPDGRNVYVGSANGHRRLDVLARDAKTGQLRSVGCFLWVHSSGNFDCPFAILRGFRPSAVTISPDGTSVYVAGGLGFYVFRRNVASGRLTLVSGAAGCFLSTATTHCTRIPHLGLVSRISLPADGRHVYVGRHVFRRNAGTNALEHLDVRVPGEVEFSPDGLTAYQGGSNLRIYRRASTGALTLLRQPFGVLPGYVDELVVMPDGRHVYALGRSPTHLTTRTYRVA